jgi:hypothetical protein
MSSVSPFAVEGGGWVRGSVLIATSKGGDGVGAEMFACGQQQVFAELIGDELDPHGGRAMAAGGDG